MIDARGFFKYFEDYHHQISRRAAELFGPESPDCKDEIAAINSYLLSFEVSLSKLSEAILKIHGLKSPLFSLGNYLATLSERCRKEEKPSLLCKGIFGSHTADAKWKGHIHFIQKIAAHSECTDEIRLGLVAILRKNMKDAACVGGPLDDVLRQALSHSFPMDAPLISDIERLSIVLDLPSGAVPQEFKTFLHVKYSESKAAYCSVV